MPGGIYKSASTLVFPNNKVKMDKGYTGTNFNKALLLFLSLVPTSLSTLVFSPPQFKIQSLQVSHVSSTSIHRYLFFFFFPSPLASHFTRVASIFIRPKQGLCLPACQPPRSPERCRSAACSDSREDPPHYSPPRCHSERCRKEMEEEECEEER